MNSKASGWINIYKEEGITSLSISKALKKKFNFKKLGHLGTLDPLAEGVLPIAVGEATKSIKFITNNKKKYTFIIKWGEETNTCDREGKIIKRRGKKLRKYVEYEATPETVEMERGLKFYNKLLTRT